jgi:hypothetical protein
MLEVFFEAEMLLIKGDGSRPVLHRKSNMINACKHYLFLLLIDFHFNLKHYPVAGAGIIEAMHLTVGRIEHILFLQWELFVINPHGPFTGDHIKNLVYICMFMIRRGLPRRIKQQFCIQQPFFKKWLCGSFS